MTIIPPVSPQKLIDHLTTNGHGIVTAESCTGGLICGTLTEAAGASAVIDRSFITYANQAKSELLGVSTDSLETHGAVSAEVVVQMAEGALQACPSAHYSLAVTGIAGPGGATETKPVGMVYIGCGVRGGETTYEEHIFAGNRAEIRRQTVEAALSLLAQASGLTD